ncbi:MAG: ferredoxin [Actinomycetota bacterium]|jgi:ferredoxin|nr:ferredoxin [Actinomycetota bacterium]
MLWPQYCDLSVAKEVNVEVAVIRVDVDLDLCASHGQCEFAAPEVFTLDDNADLAFVAEPGDDQAAAVRAAVRVCPTRAIRVVE